MKPEAQRIAIASVMKLDKFHPFQYATRRGRLLPAGETGVRLMYCSGGTNGWQDWEDIPNYPSDLNAMAKAEQTLSEEQKEIYTDHLRDISEDEMWPWEYACEDRAEAFLRTLGLWKDEPA